MMLDMMHECKSSASKNSAATKSTALMIISLWKDMGIMLVTASSTQLHIKRISYSNTGFVDYKVTSRVPVTSAPMLPALMPL